MVLIARRACVIGAIGLIVSITLHLDARGAILREGLEARFPRGAMSMETPVLPEKAGNIRDGEAESTCELSFATTASGSEGGQRGIFGYGRNGQPRASQLVSAPQPDSGTAWDSERPHISLRSDGGS